MQPGVQPGAARHIASRVVEREQYYTNENLAEKLVSMALDQDIGGDALFLEPSVGDGVVYAKLPERRRIGVEICEDVKINCPDDGLRLGQDFLKFDLPVSARDRSVIVVGNPPFGGDAQIRFLNHAARLECKSLTIVFILGLSMRKWSNIFKVDERLHLVDERIVPRAASHFKNHGARVTVPTVVQVWKRKNEPRSDPELLEENEEFDVLPCVEWRRANIVLKRFASLSLLGEVGVVGEDVDFVQKTGKQVNAHLRRRPCRRFGTVVGKSGAQGTLMLIKARNVDKVAARIRTMRADGTFREYANATTSNVGNGVCVNKRELFTLYRDPRSITRTRKYL